MPVDPWKRRLFLDLLASAQRGFPGKPHGALSLDRSAEKPPLQLVITPLETLDGLAHSGQFLIKAIDLDQTHAIPEGILKQLYRFTAAEAEIANSLLRGLSLVEIALLRKVSLATVRSQVKTLLDKAGTNRQVDLLRKLLLLAREFPLTQASRIT